MKGKAVGVMSESNKGRVRIKENGRPRCDSVTLGCVGTALKLHKQLVINVYNNIVLMYLI